LMVWIASNQMSTTALTFRNADSSRQIRGLGDSFCCTAIKRISKINNPSTKTEGL
jgi:hypothetical protein